MKKALKTFWKEITISASDAANYKTLTKKPFASALRYLFWLLVCTSLVTTIMVCATVSVIIPHISPFLHARVDEVRDLYPENLTIAIREGRLSTNSSTPVIIAFPPSWKELMEDAAAENDDDDEPAFDFDHLLTIDTRASASDYEKYHSVVLMTQTAVIFPDDNTGGVRTVPYQTDQEIMVTREVYTGFVDKITPYADTIPKLAGVLVVLLLFVLPFILGGLSWIWYLIYLLPISLLAWLLATIMQRKHTYGQIYHMGIYALTLPIFYSAISFWVPFLRVPFIFTLIFLVWMGVVFGAERVTKRKTA